MHFSVREYQQRVPDVMYMQLSIDDYSGVFPHCKLADHNQQVDHGLVHVAPLLEETVSWLDSSDSMAMWSRDVTAYKVRYMDDR